MHGTQVDLQLVNEELQSLRPASRGAPDPVSKLWPNHYSTQVQRSHESGGVNIAPVNQPLVVSYVGGYIARSNMLSYYGQAALGGRMLLMTCGLNNAHLVRCAVCQYHVMHRCHIVVLAAGLKQIEMQSPATQSSNKSTQHSKLKQRFPDHYEHYGY